MFEEQEISIEELKNLYESNLEFEIKTPDGFQKIGKWFNKGKLPMVAFGTENYQTRCAENHMIQMFDQKWVLASELNIGDRVLTIDGAEEIIFKEYVEEEECFDFEILHENHRYYGDGIVSHNSGKSYLCSGNVVRHAQEQGIFVVLFDSENALDKTWLERLGVDTSSDKLMVINVAMINDVAKIINDFMVDYKKENVDINPDERPKVLFVIDSLGMLLTPADLDQFQKGDLKGNMGWTAKQLKALVKNCVVQMGEWEVGLLATNHTYASQDMFDPDPKISGGCLTEDIMVYDDKGNLKSIKDFNVGDKVLTTTGSSDVVSKFEYNNKDVYEIILEDDYVITCTPEHKFLVNRSNKEVWVKASDLTDSDQILSIKFGE